MPQFDTTFFSSLLFWSVVSFLILLAFLWKYALPVVFDILENRERRIRDNLDEAERRRVEAEQRLAEYEAKLREASQDAERIVEAARLHAQRMLDENQKKIQTETERMLDEARRDIDREYRQAMQAIQSQAVDLSVQLAERILVKNISEDDHRRFTEHALQEVADFYAEDR